MATKSLSKRGRGPAFNIRGARPGARGKAPALRPLRADAAANRALILAAAAELLAQRGLDVSLDEIAAHAGVGPGTVHRHFPTKDALWDATIAGGLTELAREANRLAQAEDPVAAFYDFVVRAVERGSSIHALARRLWGSTVNVDGAIAAPLRDLRGGLTTLFHRAQRAQGVRRDLGPADLDALLAAAHVANVHAKGGRRLVEVILDGMRGPAQPRDTPPIVPSSRRVASRRGRGTR